MGVAATARSAEIRDTGDVIKRGAADLLRPAEFPAARAAARGGVTESELRGDLLHRAEIVDWHFVGLSPASTSVNECLLCLAKYFDNLDGHELRVNSDPKNFRGTLLE